MTKQKYALLSEQETAEVLLIQQKVLERMERFLKRQAPRHGALLSQVQAVIAKAGKKS